MGVSIITVFLYVLYGYGIGSGISKFLPMSKEPVEQHLMRFGIGLGVIPFIAMLLNLLHIPLHFTIFLVLAILGIILNYKALIKIQQHPSLFAVGAFILFFFSLFIYTTGAFSYPYLEDDDPWAIAKTVAYVAQEKTGFVDEGVFVSNYIDPYPPAYFMFLGLLYQTSPDLQWTLKFFNALTISLAILFFFFLVRILLQSSKKAFYATLVLAMVPAFLSHFIWAIAFTLPLFMIAMYCFLTGNKRWYLIGAIVFAGIIMTHPSTGPILGILIASYWGVKALVKKPDPWLAAAGITAVILSMIWWMPIMIDWGGPSGILEHFGGASADNLKGSATRVYTFKDFFVATPGNLINNPIGFGIIPMILMLIGLIYTIITKKKLWQWVILAWFVFTFLAVNGERIGVAFFSFRMWMILALPFSILAAEGMHILISSVKRFNRLLPIAAFILLLVGIWGTAGYYKYRVNTDPWPSGGWLGPSPGSLQALMFMKDNFPADTKVFEASMEFIYGVNMQSCDWCEDESHLKENFHTLPVEEIYSILKRNGYEYLFFDGSLYAKWNDPEETTTRLNEIAQGPFDPVYQSQLQGQPTPDMIFRVR
ncbi:MAG: glycosyltransferase family 39 protein [Nanoarchaeota archaeon]